MKLLEGGNVFKNADGSEATQRINQADIRPTVAWLEQLTGLPLLDNMLGSTGKKPSSGDLDLAVDANNTSKDQLVAHLTRWVQSHGEDPKQWVKKSGISVHFKTPINGRPAAGFVQTDFMFVTDVSFSKFIITAPPDSAYRGQDRNILINSIAKAMGYKLNQTAGIMDRATNQLIANDPDKIAKILLNQRATRDDLHSVETILAALKNDRNRDAKLADAREHFARAGIPFDQPVQESVESDTYFLAKLRDRIVNCGMTPLIEGRDILEEGVRIEHPEDLLFSSGAPGALQAIAAIAQLSKSAAGLSVKWDGKPAVIFGRDDNGFILTDKSGFIAKGYNGLARSPADIQQIMSQRSGDRTELVDMYRRVWPYLRAVVPQNFRGFIQGDLLWSETPGRVGDDYVFTPNTVTYRVAVDSPLGQQIGKSVVGIAVHTYYPTVNAEGTPWHQVDQLAKAPGVVVLTPEFTQQPVLTAEKVRLNKLAAYAKANTIAIDALLNPLALRELKITDLPALMKKYINSRVRAGNFDQLAAGLMPWIQQQGITPAKVERIQQHLVENQKGFNAAFTIFIGITALKQQVIEQLDSAEQDIRAEIAGTRGHEGYVYAQGNLPIKLVDRMKFSRLNFNKNNPVNDE